MTRASGLAVLGGLIVFTVLFSLTRVVPAPDIDANLNIASHNSPQNRRDLGVSTKQIKKKLIAFIGVQVWHRSFNVYGHSI